MDERHENEQYFFAQQTVDQLAKFVAGFKSPCCLCAPTLGRRVAELGAKVAVLDIDERFADVTGFQKYDLNKPSWIEDRFDLIICDPPFFNVSLSKLFASIRMLSHHDFSQPVMISYLSRRGNAVESKFSSFNLKATGYRPGYETVRSIEKNEIEFFGNLKEATTRLLFDDTVST